MPQLWNLDHQHAIYDADEPGVAPGEAHDFTDAQAASLTGSWSEDDPRAGLDAEREFKRLRDAKRADLDAEALELGIDPDELPNRQAVIEAIRDARTQQHDEQDDGATTEPDDNQNPAESGETEE